jgi:hypothetical protein
MPFGERVLHYARLDAFRKKVPSLLRAFRFAPVSEILDRLDEQGQLMTWRLQGE